MGITSHLEDFAAVTGNKYLGKMRTMLAEIMLLHVVNHTTVRICDWKKGKMANEMFSSKELRRVQSNSSSVLLLHGFCILTLMLLWILQEKYSIYIV
ncbi:uncharacterized protein LOC110089692 [Pogona vitticeps]